MAQHDNGGQRPPFTPPGIIPDEILRRLGEYRQLCERYDLDPDKDWQEDGCESLEATIAFLAEFDELRRRLAGWSPDTIAAFAEAALTLASREPRAPAVIGRYGEMVIVADEWGQAWALTATPANPRLVALAMTRQRMDESGMS